MKVNIALLPIIALPQVLTTPLPQSGPTVDITPSTTWADLMNCNECAKILDNDGYAHSILSECDVVFYNNNWVKLCFCVTNPNGSNSGHQVIPIFFDLRDVF